MVSVAEAMANPLFVLSAPAGPERTGIDDISNSLSETSKISGARCGRERSHAALTCLRMMP
jgi:hypothetical protein